jgi:hypothetical protein
MKTTPMKLNQILMLLASTMLLLGAATKVQATTYTAVVTGDFSSPATFSPSGTPGSGDTVVVSNGVTLMVSDTRVITTLTVGKSGGSGSTLTISSSGSLTVSGQYGFAGTSPVINNNGAFGCGGGASYSTGAFNNNGTATFLGSSQAFNGTIAVTQGANATLNFSGGGSVPFGGNCTLSASASGNTVNYAAGGQNLYGTTYYNLTVSGTSPSASGGGGTTTKTVNGTLTINLNSGQQINSAGNITFGSGANIIRTLGALNGTPTFSGTVNVTYNGASAMTTGSELPTSGTALNNLTIIATASVTLNANATVNGAFSATYNGSTVPLITGSKTLAFVNSPVNITVSGSALASGNSYTIVSSSGTTVSGSLGAVTVTGLGAPYSSPTASTSTGQLVLTIPNCTATTAAPVITTSAMCSGSTSISGTSANNAFIVVYDGSTQIGTATADGSGAWTATITPAVGGDTIMATAQVSGECASSASTGLTVQTTTATPSITSPINTGATSISGTSASGASIVVYDGAVQIGTATASGTSWTATVGPAVSTGDSITATAQVSGQCLSSTSTAVTVVTTTTNTLAIVAVGNTNINAGAYLIIPSKVLTNGVPAN